jgi:hypothetical protein
LKNKGENKMTKIISDYSESDPLKHIAECLLDNKADLLEYEKSDTDSSDEERCRGNVEGLAFCLAYLQTLSPQAIEKLAKDTLERTHPLLDNYGIILSPPQDASTMHSNYWCVSDVRHWYGDKVKHMTDEDISSNLQDLSKRIESSATESGWDAIDWGFEISDIDDEDE